MDTHLKGIGVENFRVFKDEQYFDFAPITLLTGTNSSGKSSLINLIKLLSETYRKISWRDSYKYSFTMDNLLKTGLPKDWCIKSFGNVGNVRNKHSNLDSFSFSYKCDLPGYKNSIRLKITYEFNLLKEGKSHIDLQKIKIVIDQVSRTSIINDLINSGRLVQDNVDFLLQKEIFSIDFEKSKSSNSKIALDILSILFEHQTNYVSRIQKKITALQEKLNEELTEEAIEEISLFMKDHDLKHEIYTDIENDSYFKIRTIPNILTKRLNTFLSSEKPFCISDAWCTFNSQTIIKTEALLNNYYGTNNAVENHKMLNRELFTLLSNAIWFSSYFENTPEDTETDTSYIYFGSSLSSIEIKNSYAFSLKDFLKRVYYKHPGKFFNEDFWLDIDNGLFYDNLIVNKKFIKNLFLPLIKIIIQESKQDLGKSAGMSPMEMDNFLLNIEPGKFKTVKITKQNGPINDYDSSFLISQYEENFYDPFILDILRLIFEPLDGFKIVDSISNQRTYQSRIVSVLSIDETSVRIAANTLNDSKLQTLKIFWKKHLIAFEIAEDIKIDIDQESMFYKIFLLVNDEWINLKDMGYGVSQIIPILLSLSQELNPMYWSFEDDDNPHLPIIMLIEEPESNLHPALQSKLADFFVEAAEQFNIQFIIETHSEYLIRKLQYLTAKKEIKPSDTQLYYFHHPDRIPGGQKQIYPINIKADGALTKDFGKGFFDEADNIALELFLLKAHQNN